MPFKVKKQGRKRYRNRKTKVSKSVKKYVKKVVRAQPEVKVCQRQEVLHTVGNSLAINGDDLLSNMYRGTTETLLTSGQGELVQGMLGLQVRLRRLLIHGHITGFTGTTYQSAPQTTIFRLMVVLDKQASNNTLPQLFNSASAYDNLVLQTNLLCSPYYMPATRQPRRFQVLYDKTFTLSSNEKNTKMFKISIPLKDQILQYFPTSTTFYELNKRLRFFYVENTDQPQGQVQPWISYISSVSYTDA